MQEALTNCLKHAGAGSVLVTVHLDGEGTERELRVEIVDDGRGVPAGGPAAGGHGLAGMRERAALVGGWLHAGPGARGGFRVAAVLPVAAAAGGLARERGRRWLIGCGCCSSTTSG